MANGMDKKTIKRMIFVAAALCGFAALLGLSLVLPRGDASYLSFTGLEDADQVKVQLQTQSQLQILMASEDHALSSPADIGGNYILNVSIDRDGNYHDILFNINQTDDKLSLTASGFTPGDTLHIRRGKKEILSALHFDWAGRIEIDHDFSGEKAGPLCLETASGFSTCHLLPKGDRA